MQHHDFSDSPATCVHCGELAAGPCARCEVPLCGACCIITEGGTKPYAICRDCAANRGTSLQRGWTAVVSWIALPIVVLVLALLVLGALFGGD